MIHLAMFAMALASVGAEAKICELGFLKAGHLHPGDLAANRKKISDYARIEGLPAFEVELSGAYVPVILLNRKTVAHWDWVLNETFGIAQALHPGNEADHGFARLPGQSSVAEAFRVPGALYGGGVPTGALSDLYSPAQADERAAAGTGYHWMSVGGYFNRRKNTSTEYVDLAYAANPLDRIRFWLYHAVKRSGVVRIQYAFDEKHNSWARSQRRMLQEDPGFRDEGYEQCNNSRCGELAPLHVREMRGRLARLLNRDANDVYNTAEGRLFLDEAKNDLLKRDWRDRSTYQPEFLDQPRLLGIMDSHFRHGLSHDDKVDALSYLFAINVFEELIELRRRLGIQETRANQYSNPNISAILIYSDYPENVDRFYDANITLNSAPSDRGNNGFSSAYFKTRRIFEHHPYPEVKQGYRP